MKQKQENNKVIPALWGIFLLSLLLLSNNAWSIAYTYNDTYVPANFYTLATGDGVTKTATIVDGDNRLWDIGPGAALKVAVLVPAGVSYFRIDPQVSSWVGLKVGRSYTSFASTEESGLTTTSAWSAEIVGNLGLESGTVAAPGKTAYIFFHNTTSGHLYLNSLSFRMVVASSAAYNDWVSIKDPQPQGQQDGSASGGSSGGGSSGGGSSGGDPIGGGTNSGGGSSGGGSTGGGGTCGGLNPPCPTSGGGTANPAPAPAPAANSLSTDAQNVKTGLTGLGVLGGTYSENDDYVFWSGNSSFDFGDGNGRVDTRMKFRINKKEIEAFFAAGKNFDIRSNLDGADPVNDYRLWAMQDQNDAEDEGLFFYPDVDNEEALVKYLSDLSNVIHAGLSNGVLYVVTDDNQLHRGVLNHHMIEVPAAKSAPSGKVIFDAVNDLNGDGLNDFRITYDDGFQQYLYYRR